MLHLFCEYLRHLREIEIVISPFGIYIAKISKVSSPDRSAFAWNFNISSLVFSQAGG